MTTVTNGGVLRYALGRTPDRASLGEAPRRIPGADAAWWRGAVIYQIYPRSFFDSNGDGIGDLPGIAAKLDHVASLGVDAVWLCPFFTSPQKDFGYDVADHISVDPLFGTLADFDALVARAHRLGLRVLIDQVWSHSSDRHPWFLESRASRANPKADWYVWADPSPDGTPPNNWLSVFGGAAWTWEPRRRQYYLHHFLSHQPSFNLHNPQVLDAILETGRFWLERGVDGFRLDAMDFLLHDAALRDNPAAPPADGNVPAKLFGLQTHVHDMLQPGGMDIMARIRALMDEYPGTATIGEVSSQPGAFHRVVGYTAGERHLHMAYTLRPLRGGFDWPTLQGLLREVAEAGEAGWVCWSFSNHDVERAVSRWNPRRGEAGSHRAGAMGPEAGSHRAGAMGPDAPDPRFARLLMSLLLSLRGSVCLYQGEELGLTEAKLEFEQMRDPFGIAYWPEFRGRDGSRTPLPWHPDLPHAGFTEGDAPWLPVPASHRPLAVAAQEADPAALLHAWRDALAFRRAHSALIHGSLTPLATPEPLIGFVRESAEERMLCLFNLSGAELHADLGIAGLAGGTVLPAYGSAFIGLAQSEVPALAAE